MKRPAFIVVAGGGSPHSDAYRSVYGLIEHEAIIRGFDYHLIDFVGCGHSPNEGSGLDFRAGLERVISAISCIALCGRMTVFARSFGSNLLCRALACEPSLAEKAAKLILWGPSPFHTYWHLVASESESLISFNRKALEKGLRLSGDFWSSMRPIEEDLFSILHLPVILARGERDQLCTAAFAQYLKQLVLEKSGMVLPYESVPGAGHEVRAGDPPEVLDEYCRLLFSSHAQKCI